MDLIEIEFRGNTRGYINYEKLINAIRNFKPDENLKGEHIQEVSEKEIELYIRELYTNIKKKFATLEDFFLKYQKRDEIHKSDFIIALTDLGMKFEANVYDNIWEVFVPRAKANLQLLDLNRIYQKNVENDIKPTIGDIIHTCWAQDKRLPNVFELFEPSVAGLLKYTKFIDALQTLDPKLDEKRLKQLLNYLGIAKTTSSDINTKEFLRELDSTCERLRLYDNRDIKIIFIPIDPEEKKKQLLDTKLQGTKRDLHQQKTIADFKTQLKLSNRQSVMDLFKTMDTDKSNQVDLKEFKRVIKLMNKDFTDDKILEIYNLLDEKGNRNLSMAEMIEKLEIETPGKGHVTPTRVGPAHQVSFRGDPKFSELFQKLEFAKDIFIEIQNLLNQRKNETFNTFFKVQDKKATISLLKTRFSTLQVKSEGVTKMLNLLLDGGENVNLEWFQKCFQHFTDPDVIASFYDVSPIKTPAHKTDVKGIYADIKRVLTNKNLTFAKTFEQFGDPKKNTLGESMLKYVLEVTLEMKVSQSDFDKIIKENSDNDGHIYLDQLRKNLGILQEAKPVDDDSKFDVIHTINSLRDALKSAKAKPEALFDNVDTKKTGFITSDQFKEIITKIDPTLDIIKCRKIFQKVDKSESGKLSRYNFCQSFDDQDTVYKRACTKLKDAIKNAPYISLREAWDQLDAWGYGHLDLKALTLIVAKYDPQMHQDDIDLIFSKLTELTHGKLIKDTFLHEFTPKVEDHRGKEDSRIRKLLEEIQEKVSLKSRTDVEKMFAFIDRNNDSRISLTEFENFVQQIDANVNKSDVIGMFKIIDANNNTWISKQDLQRYFMPLTRAPTSTNLDKSMDKSPMKKDATKKKVTTRNIDELVLKTKWASKIFEEIGYLITIEESNFDSFFQYEQGATTDKLHLKKKFETLGITMSPEAIEKFLEPFYCDHDEFKIELLDFRKVFYHFTERPLNSIQDFKMKNLDELREDILNALDRLQKNPGQAFDHLDTEHKGTCSVADLQNYLINSLGIKNNTKLQILYDHIRERIGFINLIMLVRFLLEKSRDPAKQKELQTEAVAPKEQDNDLKGLIGRIRSLMEESKMSIETIFKKFEYKVDGEVTYDEFYRGLKFFDEKLQRDQIWSLYNHLDKDKKGSISKMKFITYFGAVTPEIIAEMLDWALPIFEEIGACMKENKIQDIADYMKPEGGFVDRSTFKSAIYFTGFNLEKYPMELEKIMELLSNEQTGLLYYNAFDICMKRANDPKRKMKKSDFTPKEIEKIQDLLLEIAKLMKLDNIDFDKLFLAKDEKKRGSITVKQMNDTLINELMMTKKPELETLYIYLMDKNGEIDLLRLREGLKSSDKEIKKAQSLEFFLKEIKRIFSGNTEQIVKFFDFHNTKKINKKEFQNAAKRAMNLDPSIADFYFGQMDENNDGIITDVEFKDILESEITMKKELFLRLRAFIRAHKILLSTTLAGLDSSGKGMIPSNHIKIGFSNIGFQVSQEDLDYMIDSYNIAKDKEGRYDYTSFMEKCMAENEEAEAQAELEKLLKKLRAELVAKKLNFEKELKILDVKSDGFIVYKDIWEHLSGQGIYLQRDEKNILWSFLHKSPEGRVEIKEMVELFQSKRKSVMTKDMILKETMIIRDYLLGMKLVMRKNYLTVAKLLGTTNDRVLLRDFIDSIAYIGYRTDTEEVKILVKVLSEDEEKGEKYISVTRFEYLLDNIDEEKRDLQGGDAKFLEDRLRDIRNFMIQDKKTFSDVFRRVIRVEDNALNTKEFEYCLFHGLGLEPDPTLRRFCLLIMDKRGLINLETLEKTLNIPTNYTNSKSVVLDVSHLKQGSPNKSTVFDPMVKPQIPSLMMKTVSVDGNMAASAHMRASNISDAKTVQTLEPSNTARGSPVQSRNPTSLAAKYSKRRNTRELSEIVNASSNMNYSGDLFKDLQTYFKVKKLNNQERYFLFDPKLVGKFSQADFISTCRLIGIKGVQDAQMIDLFKKLDVSKSNFVSENEFRLRFDTADGTVQDEDVKLTREMQDEISTLFNQLDTDKNGFLTVDELAKALARMGGLASNDEVAKIFNQIDKDKNGEVSFDEFKSVMQEKMKKDILKLEELVSDLRREFKRVDINGRNELNPEQLGHCMNNLGITLTLSELQSLVDAIDANHSGTIDIDEFIGFIMSPDGKNSLGDEASNAIYNIRRANKISPLDLVEAFRNMPINYVFSFTRDLNKKLENLPSASLKPKHKLSATVYNDIEPNPELHIKGNANCYTLKPIPTAIGGLLNIQVATGIPIPDSKSVDRANQIIGRELRVVFFSKIRNKFEGGVVSIPVIWKPQYEDRWYFPDQANNLLFRMTEWDSKSEMDRNMIIVFEFVLHFKRGVDLIDMSCGWASIDVQQLQKSQTFEINLQGGTPQRLSTIHPDDIRTTRTGFRHLIKKLSKSMNQR